MKSPAEIEARNQPPKKFSRKVAKMEAGKKTSDSTKSGDVRKLEGFTNGVFASSTVDQLKEYAKTNEIDLSG
jgi:hypothetical protein